MNPEVIFIFIVLAIINSIFNKNKVQKKQQQRRNQQSQQFEKQQVDSQQKMAQRKSQDTQTYRGAEEKDASAPQERETQTRSQKPRSLLEEVLQQYNLSESSTQQKPENKTPTEPKTDPVKPSKEKKKSRGYSHRTQPQKLNKNKVVESYKKSRKSGIESGELGGDFFSKTSVEKNQIGTEGFDELLSFDQKSLVQGIVMAEILGKPKALQKKKTG